MTPVQLSAATGARVDRATEWLAPITAAMAEFGIDAPLRQAMFLAQVGHESGGLHWLVELWGPTAAQAGYEGRKDLGNTQPGDGIKFRGRGLIQITGRANYATAGSALGFDLINGPEALGLAPLGARSAAWWWQKHGLNKFADARDLAGCTRVINGGENGLADRQALYAAALAILVTS